MMPPCTQFEFQSFTSKPKTKMIKVKKNLICILWHDEKKLQFLVLNTPKPQFFDSELLCFLFLIYHSNFIQIGQKMQKLVFWGG